MKHAGAGANYVMFTKLINLQHEKKPVLNLESMEDVGFEQTSTIFIEIFVL